MAEGFRLPGRVGSDDFGGGLGPLGYPPGGEGPMIGTELIRKCGGGAGMGYRRPKYGMGE